MARADDALEFERREAALFSAGGELKLKLKQYIGDHGTKIVYKLVTLNDLNWGLLSYYCPGIY